MAITVYMINKLNRIILMYYMKEHRSFDCILSSNEKEGRNADFNEIQTQDPEINVVVLYQLSYQANWKLVIM